MEKIFETIGNEFDRILRDNNGDNRAFLSMKNAAESFIGGREIKHPDDVESEVTEGLNFLKSQVKCDDMDEDEVDFTIRAAVNQYFLNY